MHKAEVKLHKMFVPKQNCAPTMHASFRVPLGKERKIQLSLAEEMTSSNRKC